MGLLPAGNPALAGLNAESRLHLQPGRILSRYGNPPAALAQFRRYPEPAPENPDAEGLRTPAALLPKRPAT